MDKIRIEVLGPFRLLHPSGREIRVPSGKLTHLLKLLAYEENGVPREHVLDLLWPDATAEAARRSLRQALSTIRGSFETDPFADIEWLALDKSVCSCDSWALAEHFANLEYGTCLSLVRGPLAHTEPTSAPTALMQSWERWYDTTMDRLHSAALAEARGAVGEGDAVRAEHAIAQAVLAGISEVALRRNVRGVESTSLGWSDRRVGVEALESVVFRARRELRPICALVIESEPGWTLRSIESTLRALPERTSPALISFGEERQLGDLLDGLLQLPGGAGVGTATEDIRQRLIEPEPYAMSDERAQLSVMNALAEALEATTDEQAVMLVGSANELHQSTATLLSRAISRFGGHGLTVVLVGEDEMDFQRPAVATLQTAFEGSSHILQSDRETLAEDHHLTGVASAPSARWTTHTGWAIASLALAALTAVMTTRSGQPVTTAPPLSEDVIFCSGRGGAPQYYRWGQTLGVERISPDTAFHVLLGDERRCSGRLILSARADSFHLPVLSGGRTEWRTYPNSRTRGNLRGVPIVLDETTAVTVATEGDPFIVLARGDEQWTLFDTHEGRTLSIPVPAGGRISELSGPSALVLSLSDAGKDAYSVIDRTTGEVTAASPGLIHEAHPGWISDSQILLARGAMGADEDGSLELVLVNTRDGTEDLLTRNDWNDYEVTISPDRTHACWQSEEYGHYQSDIRVMRIADWRILPQEEEPGRQSGCHFSSDGSFVVYSTYVSGDRELVARPIGGGPRVPITLFPGDEHFVGSVPIR